MKCKTHRVSLRIRRSTGGQSSIWSNIYTNSKTENWTSTSWKIDTIELCLTQFSTICSNLRHHGNDMNVHTWKTKSFQRQNKQTRHSTVWDHNRISNSSSPMSLPFIVELGQGYRTQHLQPPLTKTVEIRGIPFRGVHWHNKRDEHHHLPSKVTAGREGSGWHNIFCHRPKKSTFVLIRWGHREVVRKQLPRHLHLPTCEATALARWDPGRPSRSSVSFSPVANWWST